MEDDLAKGSGRLPSFESSTLTFVGRCRVRRVTDTVTKWAKGVSQNMQCPRDERITSFPVPWDLDPGDTLDNVL